MTELSNRAKTTADREAELLALTREVEVLGELPEVNSAGPDLPRLFQNLIGNAIKYRLPDRPPVVTVSAETRAMTHVVTVRDNGIGINPEFFDTIFGVFKRLHTQDKYDGTAFNIELPRLV